MIENLKQTDLNADDKIILAKINHNIGNVFYDKEEYPEALNFFKNSLDIFKSLDLEDEYFKCVYMRMSFVYEKNG
jgi:hypothetical protein